METDLLNLVCNECVRAEKVWSTIPREKMINTMINYIEEGWISKLSNIMQYDNSPNDDLNLMIQQFENISQSLKVTLKIPIDRKELDLGIIGAKSIFNKFFEQYKDNFFQENDETQGLILESLVPIMGTMRFLINEFNQSDKENELIVKYPIDLSKVYFISGDHIRYENGTHVSGPHGGAKRAIKIEPNISGMEGYTVTIFNLQGNHPVWGNNIQMAPKCMRVISAAKDKIVLKGYGSDPNAMGDPAGSYANYGITIFISDNEIEKIITHLHDRNIDVEYSK